jgi:chromosome segregation ATPase
LGGDAQVVSKDGSLISKSGIMTGGDPSFFDSKLRRWQQSDTEKLQKEYRQNHDELQVRAHA